MRTTASPTPTESEAGLGPRTTRIAVSLAGSGVRHDVLDQGDHVAPRPVWARGSTSRIALVGIAMMLLPGDDVRIDVEVGDGATLELTDAAALIAHDSRGGSCSWSMHVRLGADATFVYDGRPFVAASGADATRRLTIDAASGSRVLLRETLVLGRHRQPGGIVRARTRIRDAVGDLFADDLDFGAPVSRLTGVTGDSRVLDSVLAVGWQPDDGPDVLRLEEGGALARRLGQDADVLSSGMDERIARWGAQLDRR